MKRVTLKDIAAALGVSVGTVSHALSDMDDISEEVKIKVREKTAEMGYISDDVANSLRSGKTNTIAIIVPDISNHLISSQIKLIETQARQNGYAPIIFNTNENEEIESSAIMAALRKRVDGILLCPAQHNKDNLRLLQKRKVPFVLFGRFFESEDTSYVCSDDVKGGRLAAEYLLNIGCRNPVYIGTEEYLECSVNRLRGIKEAFAAEGLSFPESRVIRTSSESGYGMETCEKLSLFPETVDSIIVFSDTVAFDIRYHLLNLKSDLAVLPVISFDMTHSYYPLPFHHISIGMKGDGLASESFRILMNRISDPESPNEHVLIDVELHEFCR
ncbi:MAG: LacI family DNA-binding transcriptional regulator [Clostridia bacterium]|nr:LacI family DNA-binding transcriptional regulator [Clostridia bacterium]